MHILICIISVGCDHPGSVADGFVIPDQMHPYNFGQKVEFACREPLMLDGESEIYCTDGNTWSHPTPTCIKRGNNKLHSVEQYRCLTETTPAYFDF